MVLVQNDISRIFLFFQTFDFLGYRGVKGQKIAQNDKKLCLLYLISQLRDHTSYDYHLWSTSVKWYLQVFFIIFLFFQNFDFLGC